jgi:hypothetical protein
MPTLLRFRKAFPCQMRSMASQDRRGLIGEVPAPATPSLRNGVSEAGKPLRRQLGEQTGEQVPLFGIEPAPQCDVVEPIALHRLPGARIAPRRPAVAAQRPLHDNRVIELAFGEVDSVFHLRGLQGG